MSAAPSRISSRSTTQTDRIVLHKVPSTPANPAAGGHRGPARAGSRHGIDLGGDHAALARHDGCDQCADPAARRQGRAGGHRRLPRPDRDRAADPPACVQSAGRTIRRRWCRANCASRRRSASRRTAARSARWTPTALPRAGAGDRRREAGRLRGVPAVLVPQSRARGDDPRRARGRLSGHVPVDLLRGAAGVPRIRAALHHGAQRLSAAGASTAISAISPRASAQAAPKAALGINQSSGGPDVGCACAPHADPHRAVRARRPARSARSTWRGSPGLPDVISLDMGGTSADVALMRNYTAGTTFNKWIEGYPARLASIDINAVGAGGGSIAWFDRDGLMKMGPQSAGAQPGPACYGRGGQEATVTDANLVLGRLSPRGLLDGEHGARCGPGAQGDRAARRSARLLGRAHRAWHARHRGRQHGAGDPHGVGRARARSARLRAAAVRRRRAAACDRRGEEPRHPPLPGAVRAGHPLRAGADRVGPARDLRAHRGDAAGRCPHGATWRRASAN